MQYEMPYSMFIRGLSPDLKTATQGFASLDYEITGYKQASLVKMDVLINGSPIDVLSVMQVGVAV